MKRQLMLTMFAAAAMILVVTVKEARSGDDSPVPTTPAGERCGAPAATDAPPGSVFQGCWNWFPTGACRAVYRDAAGNFSLCGKCGPTGQPNPNGCSPISSQSLATGFWCS
jgi:hypothetical protein